ncbi:LOW QUALITY PROTEIN: bryoporin-like [Colossoma macropomum]|uniref:LOW QUALITY PROTEIN: bryoporin-like n=1 Tax=Colossoma macropomum TaxID=42526 RepID=UPI001863FBB8|nr:LOW QUALITY PROTEIN: bryoporin-like [Colossoma macropomum]
MAPKGDGITSGTSFLGSTTEQISYSISTRRNITIEITNYSKTHALENPRFYNRSGYCFHTPPSVIAKNTKEECSFSKIAYAACGAVGVLTYQILSNKKHCVAELAIMFSVPFGYNLYENWFALGIYQGAVSVDYDLFKQMYYGSGPFTRCRGTWNPINHSGQRMIVKGRMSHAGQSIMKVEFKDVVFTSRGYPYNSPHPTIQRRTMEACSFTKTAGTACGAVGVLTTITTCKTQKPWMTAEVHTLLKAHDSAFRAGDRAALRTEWAKLS